MTSWAVFNREYLSIPNLLSYLRGLLALTLPFLLFHPNAWAHVLAMVVFFIGALTDYFDGLIARKFNLESRVGKFVDPVMDKLLILLPLTVFALKDLFSLWWVVPFAVREIAVTFCRIGWLMQGEVIAAERLGKWKLGFQVAMVGFAFFAALSHEVGFMQFAAGFFYALLYFCMAAALILTLLSGLTFFLHNRALLERPAFAKYVGAVGVGFFPLAPGTWGSLVGLALVFLTQWNGWLFVATFAAVIALGYWSAKRLHLSEGEDPSYVVIDEVCGMFIPFLGFALTPWTAVLGFLLFRLFDIWKPFPVRSMEKLPGYWGILSDDLAAGVYALLTLLLLGKLF